MRCRSYRKRLFSKQNSAFAWSKSDPRAHRPATGRQNTSGSEYCGHLAIVVFGFGEPGNLASEE